MSVPLLAFEGNLDPFQVSIKLPENESTIVQLRPTPYHDRFASPINHRAWALQEQVMSPHLVIFTPDGIEMVCKAMHGSREILDVRSRSLIANSKQRSTSWYRIRENYSERRLSYAGDKLIAISAIAHEMSQHFAGRYLAGLWEDTLFDDLQWITKGHLGNRPAEYRAPSWSWASMNTAVVDILVGEYFSDCTLGRCEDTLSVPDDPYGAVSGGFLELKGVSYEFKVRRGLENEYRPCLAGVTDIFDEEYTG